MELMKISWKMMVFVDSYKENCGMIDDE